MALALFVATPALAAPHPLDPLSATEIRTAVDGLHRAGFKDAARIHSLEVREPPKNEVLAWRTGQPIKRTAFAVVREDGRTYEAVIDLATRAVQRTEIPGVQPGLMPEEYARARTAALADVDFRRALIARNVGDPNRLFCWTFAAGTFVDIDVAGRRIVQVQCSDPAGTSLNPYARPISGLSALVDLDKGAVIRVLDTGAVAVPDAAEFADNQERRSTSPRLTATVDGQIVRWGDWSFHWRVDPRVGPIVSVVQFAGRSVLYQGSLSEIFVPYMDPSPDFAWRTFLDAGEYGFGTFATPLVRGIDCPDGARFFDATLAQPGDGTVTVFRNAVCLFERDAGEALWRHAENNANVRAGRARFDLVLRQTAELGLYSYTVDWVFGAGGDIGAEVMASGIDAVRADPHKDAHGGPVAQGTFASAHDHFFAFRLDVDVDEPRNSFVLGRFTLELPDKDGGRAVWVLRDDVAFREQDAAARISLANPTQWRVVSPARGTSYVLAPGENILPLVPPDDPGLARGGFANQHLWVTPYRAEERFAAGAYPNQSAGDGVPRWTQANRLIRETDIVLWYTMGFRHVPAPEDWPVLNARKLHFSLIPYFFFERNPAVR